MDCFFSRHGIGMCACSDSFFVDWDFADAHCEWCGIEPWFLYEYISENSLDEECTLDMVKEYLEKGAEDKYLEKTKKHYRLAAPEKRRFVPVFPADFDYMEISVGKRIWRADSPLVNRFIRKAAYVNDRVYNNRLAYTLRFYKSGVPVFEIPYTDVDYLPKATEIMTNQIINKLWKGKEIL
jgi:hypothetical protein